MDWIESESVFFINQLGLVAAFFVFAIIQVCYYFYYFFPLAKPNQNQKIVQNQGVSVIIAAKNESKNIKKTIHNILNQTHSNFEVIVVNDYSDDDTLSILKAIESDKLTVLNNEQAAGKKHALTQGIAAARHEILLFTDADCLPSSKDWITSMTQHFTEGIDITIGFGAFKKEGGVLNTIIRFEGFISALQYFGFANAGKAYMGVGRNLAYRKSVFERGHGFEKHKNLLSGDDDLFVNQEATSTNVAIELNESAHTVTVGERTWSKYMKQKRRQLKAGTNYRNEDKFRLAIFGSSSFLFYFLFLILMAFSPKKPIILGIFVVKQVLQYLLWKAVAQRLNVQDLLYKVFVLEPPFIFSITAIGVSTWFWKVKEWK